MRTLSPCSRDYILSVTDEAAQRREALRGKRPTTWYKGRPVLTDHSWEKMWHEHLHWKRCVLATCHLHLCIMSGCVTFVRFSEPDYHAPVQVDSGAHGALLQSCLDLTSGLNDHDHTMDAAHPSSRSFLLSLTVLSLLSCQLFPSTVVTLMHLQFHCSLGVLVVCQGSRQR